MLASLNARNSLSYMRNTEVLRSERNTGFELVVTTQTQKTVDSTHSTFVAPPNPVSYTSKSYTFEEVTLTIHEFYSQRKT